MCTFRKSEKVKDCSSCGCEDSDNAGNHDYKLSEVERHMSRVVVHICKNCGYSPNL